MELEYNHAFDQTEARERVTALADYLANKHGMKVEWLDENNARIQGKYTVVNIDAHVSLSSGKVCVQGKDPGMLLRASAKRYIEQKLETYLDPQQQAALLPRG